MGLSEKIFFSVIAVTDTRFDDSSKSHSLFADQQIHVLSRTRVISTTLQKDAMYSNVFVATIYFDEDLVGVPECVLDTSESSLTVLNQMFCQYDSCGDLPASFCYRCELWILES